jgi:RHS repeat-associated protein
MQNDTFTSGYDGMGRPISLTGIESPSALTWVQNVQYDFAGRRSSMQYLVSPTSAGYTTEAKGYNTNGQLASMTWSSGSSPVTGSLQYSYSATQNTGQITQVVDTVSGETIVYQYDALKRLTSATSTPNTGSSTTAWTQTFQYDGFGNLTAKVLNGTTTSIVVNASTNQLSSASYDYNGNMTSGVGATFTFDVANRMLSAAEVSGGVEYYGYAPDNKRIYKKLTSGVEEYTFYGGRGEKLGVYNLTSGTASALRTNVWFAGKLISENGSTVFQDRVGTNRASGARFYPYGDEITSTSNNREKFGTYTRDGYTGLDYAGQRFYASSYGRFNTPDPTFSSVSVGDPDSWNRYGYVNGDPINSLDPNGLCAVFIAGVTQSPGDNPDLTQEAINLGLSTAYPYQGLGLAASVADIINQKLNGFDDASFVAFEAITQAIVGSATPIDIIAYSGGAAAFSSAWDRLTSWQRSMVGQILYISPGSAGAPLVFNAQTSYVFGSGGLDFFATFGSLPLGGPITSSNCAHTDLSCLFGPTAAGPALSNIGADGRCSSPEVYTRTNPIGVPGLGVPAPPGQPGGGGGPSPPPDDGNGNNF